MSRKPRPPRLDDVARRAGVSTATVSRYHNNPEVVAPETAARIRKAIEATGYVPNLLAGGLASNRSRLVAVMVPEIAQSIFNDTIQAMCMELARDGYIVMLGLTGSDNSRLPALVEAALARRADGVILTGVLSDPATRARLAERGTTVIETWDIPEQPMDVAIGFSHRAAGRDIARFLHGRGYLRPLLAVAAGDRARQRRDGFLDEWRHTGGDEPEVIEVPLPTRLGHARLVWRHLERQRRRRSDVVVCGSDLLAQGVVVEALAAGVKVPGQLAVVGFGNLAIAGDMRPTLTSVEIDGARIGREAVSVLRRRAAGERITQKVIDVGFRLVARESA